MADRHDGADRVQMKRLSPDRQAEWANYLMANGYPPLHPMTIQPDVQVADGATVEPEPPKAPYRDRRTRDANGNPVCANPKCAITLIGKHPLRLFCCTGCCAEMYHATRVEKKWGSTESRMDQAERRRESVNREYESYGERPINGHRVAPAKHVVVNTHVPGTVAFLVLYGDRSLRPMGSGEVSEARGTHVGSRTSARKGRS